jgi:hypothetical protein
MKEICMKKIIFTILLMAFCGFNILAQSKITNEEYEIYTGVFEKRFEKIELDKAVTRIAILENTIEPDYSWLARYLSDKRLANYLYSPEPSGSVNPSDWEEALENLKYVNGKSEKLAELFPIEYKYNLVTKSEIDALVEEGKKELAERFEKCKCVFSGVGGVIWQPFHRKYRNSSGYYSFSRVGFSKNKKLALVFSKMESGDQGWTTFYILGETDGKWKVLKYFGSGWIND